MNFSSMDEWLVEKSSHLESETKSDDEKCPRCSKGLVVHGSFSARGVLDVDSQRRSSAASLSQLQATHYELATNRDVLTDYAC